MNGSYKAGLKEPENNVEIVLSYSPLVVVLEQPGPLQGYPDLLLQHLWLQDTVLFLRENSSNKQFILKFTRQPGGQSDIV